ncbi:MAG: hypothetical protein AAFN77_14325 [Planctomycetota bacterium]
MIVSATVRCLAAVLLIFVVQHHSLGAPQGFAEKANPRQKDVSFSQSIDVKWKKDEALVTFKQRRGKKTDTKRYTVSKMEELREQNLAAYQLYLQSQGIDASAVVSKPVELELIPNSSGSSFNDGSSYPSERPTSGPSSSSSFGGGWQVSGMVNNNGDVRRFNDSGTFGNKSTGGQNMNEQMATQLRQMIQKSDNPQIKQLLENMLQQSGKQKR